MQKNILGSLVLSLVLISSSAFAALPEAVKALHLASAGVCNVSIEDGTSEYNLDASGSSKLYLILCTGGTTTSYSRGYITQPDGDSVSITQVGVLDYSESAKALTSRLDLGDAEFNPATKVLKTQVRSNGLGDCGSRTVSKIVSGEVKTTKVNAKFNCDGRLTWPVVFSQR